MSTVTVQLELPDDWIGFNLPPALDVRLTKLLDQQDQAGSLSENERREAEALCKLVDLLALLKLRAKRASDEELT